MGTKFYVYVLLLINGKKYVGQTNNLKRRLQQHKQGKSTYTKKSGVDKLLSFEEYSIRADAMHRAKFLKWQGAGVVKGWLDQKQKPSILQNGPQFILTIKRQLS